MPCINRTPGGVIVGDSGLCCCVPVIRVALSAINSLCCFLDEVRSRKTELLKSEALEKEKER